MKIGPPPNSTRGKLPSHDISGNPKIREGLLEGGLGNRERVLLRVCADLSKIRLRREKSSAVVRPFYHHRLARP